MISASAALRPDELHRLTGWELKAEGLCRGEVCIPFATTGEEIDLGPLADRLGAALVHDAAHGLWSMGPSNPGGGRFLADTRFPDLTLPDLDGKNFSFSSLRGRKVVMVAWASW